MCKAVTAAGADYIKTSTGFSKAGATFEDIKLFSEHIGPNVKMKAAGGISSLDDAEKFLSLGADRLGTSRIVKIVKQEDIKDEVFSTGVIGKTVGIVSNDGVCYSPVDGEIASVFQTKHAMAFKSKEGTEVLMHVGIDSVNLEGEGFKVFVEEGDTVKKDRKY